MIQITIFEPPNKRRERKKKLQVNELALRNRLKKT